jgi:KUP system potassium uptake protein
LTLDQTGTATLSDTEWPKAAPLALSRRRLALGALGAVGIVYGDIGTSPLYALDQIFFGHGNVPPTHDNVLGGISLVIWALTIIVTLKYAILVLRADNDGEGGIFALYGLLHDKSKRSGSRLLLWSLVMGAGLLFGDGIITPAISVLSAVEGVSVATPSLGRTVIPLTILLLTGLFSLQAKGTMGIGKVFGPILIVWFLVIAVLGALQIDRHPEILYAFNPLYGLRFLVHANLYTALLILGAVMLCVTGGEAMYADLGHFGTLPIRIGWFSLVYPALLLNYLGQGAYLLSGTPVLGKNLFYSLVPPALLYPMVLLATLATIIASQALISGAFSLIAQAVRLGLFPRIDIVHTHFEHNGQIYVSFINWALYAGCIALVVGFGSSSALAAAYGLSVSGVMVITSIAMFAVARISWKWGAMRSGLVWGALTAVNGSFLLASGLKFLEGGYVPISIGIVVFVVMLTWQWGRKATFTAYSKKPTMRMAELIRLHRESKTFMERNAILMIPKALHAETDRTPALLQLIWDRYGVLPRNLIFVNVNHKEVPHIHDNRYHVTVFEQDRSRGSIISVDLSFGFMEVPNVESALEEMAQLKEIDLPTDRRQWIVHVSNENLLPSKTMGIIKRLSFRLFLFLRRVSQPAYYYYGLGVDVQLSAEILPVRVR